MISKKPTPRYFFDFLLSPWSILAGAACGIYLGLWYKEVVPTVSPLGYAYLNILKMCVLPILVTSISASLGYLMRSQVSGSYLRRMTILFITTMLLISMVGVGSGTLGKPGANLDKQHRTALGSIIQESTTRSDLEISLSATESAPAKTVSLGSFFLEMIPENIFNALSTGANMKVLFFAIVFGLAAGSVEHNSIDILFGLLDSVHHAFEMLIRWLMYVLPFGLCGLMAQQSADLGPNILLTMTRFVIVSLTTFIAIFVVSGLIIRWRSRQSLTTLLHTLNNPAIISFATGNSLAAIPATIKAMGNDGLRFEKRTVGLLIPLGVTLCRFGPILYFGIAGLFVSQFYHVTLSPMDMVIVAIGATLAGMASAGASGIATLAMLSLVLDPLGLPLDAVLVLFVVVDPVIAPFRSLTNILVACAVTALVAVPGLDPNLYAGKNDRRLARMFNKKQRSSEIEK